MATVISNISQPELFFGIVAPIGADIRKCVSELKVKLNSMSYNTIEIKVTDIFKLISPYIEGSDDLITTSELKRYETYINYGNKLRKLFNDDAALAVLTIARIARMSQEANSKFEKNAYIIHQFKRQEEIDLFRSVYGRQFFQVSVYSSRSARVAYLSKRFANSDNSADINEFRSHAERIVQKDYNEKTDSHGQKLVKIFHDGDVILNLDVISPSVEDQISRFIDLVFGSNSISPNKIEYGMFAAKGAALRTLDLSRQVGAAIFNDDGTIVSLGSNEVPRACGGTYWCDDPDDAREYTLGSDSNDRRKNEILSELFQIIAKSYPKFNPKKLDKESLSESQFMDALEYGRIVHAEMSAIMDAARMGRKTYGTHLYCTTFPCHMCAKHIVGAGVSKVIFLEPYPKSLVGDLHPDAICVEGADRGAYNKFPAVEFVHFFGISPRRYRELFERKSRKNKSNGEFMEWMTGGRIPNIQIKVPIYQNFYELIMKEIDRYTKIHPFDPKILNKKPPARTSRGKK